jgi:hypothetical protein
MGTKSKRNRKDGRAHIRVEVKVVGGLADRKALQKGPGTDVIVKEGDV